MKVHERINVIVAVAAAVAERAEEHQEECAAGKPCLVAAQFHDESVVRSLDRQATEIALAMHHRLRDA
ncbi:MAG: hypothetical protein Q7T55_13685, partial [Solirubrobacteraceae bacterium]|nr:hypothetical protein [Solirubrobacteraceae bacterium]